SHLLTCFLETQGIKPNNSQKCCAKSSKTNRIKTLEHSAVIALERETAFVS
ncbi:MAG: hypothetical protein ACI89J_002589, partial [Hyphomicrobiaceae bacterium]